jgi:hypothetical protein
MASVQAMMESVGQIMDSAKTVFEDIMVDEGVDLNG